MSIYDEIDLRTANVYGIFGHLGGGKTLTAVEIALDFLRHGHKVITNITLFGLEKEGLDKNYTLLPSDLEEVDFFDLPCGAPRGSDSPERVAIILDEVAEFFDQYSSTSPIVRNFMSWLRHSSKRGQFVFMIIQNREFLAKSIRILIYKWIYVVDLYQMRIPFIKVRPPFLGGFCSRRIYDRLGNALTNGLLLVDKKSIGRYYDTSQMLSRSHSSSVSADRHSDFVLPHRRKVYLFLALWLFLMFWRW